MTNVKYGNRLYYYCNLETALEYILPNRQLLLSPIEKTNDPRENRNFVFGGIYEGLKEFEIMVKNHEISKRLRQMCKVLCFSQDYDTHWGYSSSRMWAYYGGNHKGLCLLLDKEKFIEENKDIINKDLLREIKYFKFDPYKLPERIYVDHTQISKTSIEYYLKNEFIPKNIEYLYFTKDYEWQSEHEVRLIHFSDKKYNEYCKIEESLCDIYLGVDFHKSYLHSLIYFCNDINIHELNYQEFCMFPTIINK